MASCIIPPVKLGFVTCAADLNIFSVAYVNSFAEVYLLLGISCDVYLTAKLVLALSSTVILGSKPHRTYDLILLFDSWPSDIIKQCVQIFERV